MRNNFKNNGFSLIEIMVSLVLGMIVLAMVLNVFINTKQNHVQNERVTEVLENGRFAMRQLATDLKTVGFMGGIYDMTQVARDTTMDAVANECGASGETAWSTDVTTYQTLQFKYNSTAAAASTQHACITSANFQANTDVLVIKRAYSQKDTGSLTNNVAYVRSDYSSGCIWFYNSGASTAPTHADCPTTDFEDWRYMVHIYYIRDFAQTSGDGIPTLCRKRLTSASDAPAIDELCIAEGIEHFHVQYGLDTDTPRDGIADQFKSSPTVAELATAVSARLFVLARANVEDQVFANNKTYTMGDRVITVDDNYYRRLYSTTVILRNPAGAAVFTSY